MTVLLYRRHPAQLAAENSDWIDSNVTLVDTTAQTMTSDLTVPKLIASTEVSSPTGNFTTLTATKVTAQNVNTSALTVLAAASVGTDLTVEGNVSASAMTVHGGLTVGTTISASSAVFEGGVSAAKGTVLVRQATTVGAAFKAVAFTVPDGSDIDSFRFYTIVGAGSAATHTIRIGVSGDTDFFGSMTYLGSQILSDVSATVSGANNWINFTGYSGEIIIDVTAVNSVDTQMSGLMTVRYV